MTCDFPMFGNTTLMALPKVGFLSSRKVPPAAVMKCYDWATEMRDQGVCVMGGFQSPLERDVLTLLLQGKQPVIWVLARKLWTPRGVPKAYRAAIEDGRLLIVSPVAQSIRRVDAQSAAVRNRFILESAQRVVFAALDPNGALVRLLNDVRASRNIAFEVLSGTEGERVDPNGALRERRGNFEGNDAYVGELTAGV